MSLKVERSDRNIQPFSGIHFLIDGLHRGGALDTVKKELPDRPPQSEFTTDDILSSLWSIPFCGGDRIEDLGSPMDEKAQEHLRGTLMSNPRLKAPSNDTVLKYLRDLSKEGEARLKLKPEEGTEHSFHHHPALERAVVKLAIHTGVLDRKKEHPLDIDHTIVPCEKADARWSYCKEKGYQPGVVFLSGLPVHLEGRNGNTNSATDLHSHLERAIGLFREEGLGIGPVRIDAAGYQREVLDLLEREGLTYYIRAKKSAPVRRAIEGIDKWKEVCMGKERWEIAETRVDVPGDTQEARRLVITRKWRDNGQVDAFEGAYVHRAILTNDMDRTMEEVVAFYNERGATERVFDELKNDFAWSALPFSELAANTTFMYLMIAARIIFEALRRNTHFLFHDTLGERSRIKRFIHGFFTVAGKWIRRGGQWVLKLFTQRPYHMLTFPVV